MASRRRLLYFIGTNYQCGAQQHALALCTALAAEGWSVTAYTRDARAIDEPFRRAGIDIRHAPMLGFADLNTISRLANALRREHKDATIQVHRFRDAFCALLARKLARRKDIPVVMIRHSAKPALNSMLYRRIYRNLDALIFTSRLARDSFFSTWPAGNYPVPRERVKVVRAGINIASRDYAEEPQTGPTVGMFHGRLAAEKGLETLIDALPSLRGKRFRLRIVGKGDPDYVDALRSRARRREVFDMIDWAGYSHDIHPLIRNCHFGILPDREPAAFGLTNVEYMANGRAQIASCIGAPAEYLTDGHDALLVPPSDPEALSTAIERLVRDTDLRRQLGHNAFSTYNSQLRWEHTFAAMLSLYEEL